MGNSLVLVVFDDLNFFFCILITSKTGTNPSFLVGVHKKCILRFFFTLLENTNCLKETRTISKPKQKWKKICFNFVYAGWFHEGMTTCTTLCVTMSKVLVFFKGWYIIVVQHYSFQERREKKNQLKNTSVFLF